ncbi:MAG: hypothetical protein Q7R52_00900 [archaeon]|nr:hypothetical protein [archaeon]
MKSDTGAMLTKIAAIVDFVIAGLIFIAGIAVLFLWDLIPVEMKTDAPTKLVIFLIILAVFVVILVLSFLFLMASKRMRNPKTVRNGAIWAIVLGAINIGNISGILALIGGIIGLVDADKSK